MSLKNGDKDVVVTGLGVMTPLDQGQGVSVFWEKACQGINTVGPLTRFDVKGHRCNVGAEIRNRIPNAGDDPCFYFMDQACQEAIGNAGLGQELLAEAGIAVGTILGGITSAEHYWGSRFFGSEERQEGLLRNYCLDAIADGLVKKFALKGPAFSLNTACCSGADAIRTAAGQIREGRVVAMLAGGVDVLSSFVFRGFSALNAMTTDGLVRPFDKNRRGLALGEGAGVLVLEDRVHAEARGARIYCSLTGSGTAADAAHLVKPHQDSEGLARAIAQAMNGAHMQGESLDFICAHGTGTSYNDAMETKAIKRLLGPLAGEVKVTSVKSMIGHTLGASSAIEAVVCVKAMETGIIPPTINYQIPDPECDLSVVANQSCRQPVRACLSLSAGFGGQNTALVFKRERSHG